MTERVILNTVKDLFYFVIKKTTMGDINHIQIICMRYN